MCGQGKLTPLEDRLRDEEQKKVRQAGFEIIKLVYLKATCIPRLYVLGLMGRGGVLDGGRFQHTASR